MSKSLNNDEKIKEIETADVNDNTAVAGDQVAEDVAEEVELTDKEKEMQASVEELKAQAQEAAKLLRTVAHKLPAIVASLPRRALAENLKLADKRSYTRLFKGFRPHKIPKDRLVNYIRHEAIEADNTILAHIVVVLWNEAHKDVYFLCKSRLEEQYPDVEKITAVTPEYSAEVLQALIDEYGTDDTALLCKLNEVRFDKATLATMLPEFDWTNHPQECPAD